MRTILIAGLLITTGLLVGGCGSVDDLKDKATNAARTKIAQECREQARKISDPEDRRTAIGACEAARDADVDSLRRTAVRECLKQAREVADGGERRAARQQCREIGR